MGVRALSAVPRTGARAVDPDVGLVAAAREQPRAFLALYDLYFERVLGYARVRIGDVVTCDQRPRRHEPTERPEQVALAPLQLDTVARVALPPKGD